MNPCYLLHALLNDDKRYVVVGRSSDIYMDKDTNDIDLLLLLCLIPSYTTLNILADALKRTHSRQSLYPRSAFAHNDITQTITAQ